jgi:alkanesulfonate monooxygenase SsuD/methylene tetrahydromethanopterin reductase-like flavin-dependent oxidoreductase (luciferase family)
VITAATDHEAQAKLEDYKRHVSAEGSLSLLSGYLGIDLGNTDLDAPLESLEIDAIRSMVDNLVRTDPTRKWKMRDMAERAGLGNKTPMVGSPKTIADTMMGWMEEGGIDGFNISYLVSPGDFTAFVDLVVPELQRRGVYKTQYEEGTLRERLYGRGKSRLLADHPGARYRVQT